MTTPWGAPGSPSGVPFRDVRGSRVTPAGGPSPTDLPMGAGGWTGNPAAARQEAANAAKDWKVSTEAAARASGESAAETAKLTRVVEGLTGALGKIGDKVALAATKPLRDAYDDTIGANAPRASSRPPVQESTVTATGQRTGGTGSTRIGGDLVREPGDPAGIGNFPPTYGPVEPAGGARRGKPPVQRSTVTAVEDPSAPTGGGEQPLTNMEMWERGKGMGIGGIRDAVAKGISQVDIGRPYDIRDGQRVFSEDEDGNVNSRPATEQEMAANAEREATENRLRQFGGYAVEKGVMKAATNMLPAAAGRALGVAGVAYSVGSQAADFSQRQRAQNMAYGRYTGEGFVGNVDDRIQSQLFQGTQRLRQLPFAGGGLDEASAQELYSGVTQMGLSDSERDNALSFATEQFREVGMDIKDSLDLMATAAKNGNPMLLGVGESLEAVTEAAVRSGANAETARQNFVRAYASITEQGAARGQAAVTLAAGTQGALTNLGQEYAEVSGAGSTTEAMQRIIARENGMTYNDVSGMQSGGEAVQYLEMVDRHLVSRSGQLIGPEGQALVQQFIADNPVEPGTVRTPEQMRALGEQLEARMGDRMDRRALANVLMNPVFGQQGVTPANAYERLAQIVSGNQNQAGAARAAATDPLSEIGTAEDRLNAGQRMGLGDWESQGGVKGAVARSGNAVLEAADPRNWLGGGNEQKDAARSYLDRTDETGKSSATVESLIKNYSDETRLKIRVSGSPNSTKDSDYREMSIKDAIKYAPEQLERGDVVILDSENESDEGRTLADVFNGGVVNDDVQNKKASGGWKQRFGNDAGEAYDADKRGEGDGGKNGTITVIPGPKLAEWFQFQTGGPAFQSSTPPGRPANPGEQPTGNRPTAGGG